MPRKLPTEVSAALTKTVTAKKTPRPKRSVRAVENKKMPSTDRMDSVGYPVEKSREKSSSPLALAVLIILIILAVGAYLASVYFNKSAEETTPVDQSENPAADAAQEQVDPTATWLVFNLPSISTSAATSVGISFKYPPELKLTENPDNLILNNDSVSSTQVNIYWVESGKSLKDYLAVMDEVNATGWEGKPSVAITTSTEAVVISGFPAVFRQQKLLAADLNQYVIYTKAADTVFSIGLAAPELDQNLLAFFVTFLNNLQLSVK